MSTAHRSSYSFRPFDALIELWFHVPVDTKQVRFPKPISSLGMEKTLNLTQPKHAFVSQKERTTPQNKHKQLKPGLVAFYDIRPENAAGLFSTEQISNGEDK